MIIRCLEITIIEQRGKKITNIHNPNKPRKTINSAMYMLPDLFFYTDILLRK